jgi:hypothetical protein
VGIGWTVEKILLHQTQRKESQSSTSQSLLLGGNWVGLLKNTLKTKRKESQKSSTSLNPCFIGGNGWTVEKYSKTKHKEESQRAAHHSIPAL